jgi:hypothetical protein
MRTFLDRGRATLRIPIDIFGPILCLVNDLVEGPTTIENAFNIMTQYSDPDTLFPSQSHTTAITCSRLPSGDMCSHYLLFHTLSPCLPSKIIPPLSPEGLTPLSQWILPVFMLVACWIPTPAPFPRFFAAAKASFLGQSGSARDFRHFPAALPVI